MQHIFCRWIIKSINGGKLNSLWIFIVNKHSVLLLFKSVHTQISLMYWIFFNLRLFLKLKSINHLFYVWVLHFIYISYVFHLPLSAMTHEDPWTYITTNVIGWIKKYLPITSPGRNSHSIGGSNIFVISNIFMI